MDKIPNGYRPIAIRDDHQGLCVISFDRNTKTFYLIVNKVVAGPFTLRDLQQLVDNIKDVILLKGNFNYIDEYDAEGNKKL